ncbi:MAG: hypothetical protein ACOY94_24335 [Bacillota bacterium]
MRVELATVELQDPGRNLPLKAQYSALEVTEGGEWRVLLDGLKIDTLTILQDMFTSASVAQVSVTTIEGDRTSGLAKVTSLKVGGNSAAVLQGLAPLP